MRLLLTLFLLPLALSISDFLNELFAQYDTNSDGYISSHQCANQDSLDSNSKQNIHISNSMFALFDENTDRKISKQEFQHFIQEKDDFLLSDVSVESEGNNGLQL